MVPCPKCKTVAQIEDYISSEFIRCRKCSEQLFISVYPALFKPLDTGVSAEKLLIDTEASCFNHAEKKAVSVCESCGIYICALCEISNGKKTVCANCYSQNLATKKDAVTKDYVSYSRVASSIMLYSLFMYPVLVVTAPAALIYSIKHYGKPEGYFRSKQNVRMGINIAVSLTITVGMLIGLVFVLGKIN